MGEQGSSPITAVFGFGVFLTFLLGAVQITLHLFASSTVSAAAFDAARAMAAEDADRSCAVAEQRVRTVLGEYAGQVTVTCPLTAAGADADEVSVRVVGPSPAPFLDGFLGVTLDLGTIERESVVRREQFRGEDDT